jgi:hypothetical protein
VPPSAPSPAARTREDTEYVMVLEKGLAVIDDARREIAMYRQNSAWYGYAFFVMKHMIMLIIVHSYHNAAYCYAYYDG